MNSTLTNLIEAEKKAQQLFDEIENKNILISTLRIKLIN